MMQELVQSIKDNAQKAVEGIHTAVPAVIVSYDTSTGKAVVQPKALYKKPDGKKIDYPQITGVPVVFPQSQSVTIAFPIKPNDACLLICSETPIDYWLYGKETETDLKFDLSNAIAIPNICVTGNSAMQTACAENATVVQAGGTILKVTPSNVTVIGSIVVSGSITASGDVVGKGVSLSGHIHTGDSGGKTSPPL
jgi:phage baseplate assembly protein gpV